ncbi:hypothetical protein BT63DRAFT_450451 [Microthyrium microscopicum]|uniref:Nonsense-mediated mRNA decay factor n=1 Tax=Microthyrium microscopicum TaxID=703497 RepID=A0A6A6UTK8_9PEZI|nr:hypothetical protein BT63DRAFT_450451 [Microthyrium microscopicum]
MAQLNHSSETQSFGNIPFTWTCSLCNLKSTQSDEDSFLRHLDLIHSDEVELRANRSIEELNAWKKETLHQAFPYTSQGSTARPPGMTHPIKTASFKSDFQKLTIDAPGDVTEEPPGPSFRAGQAQVGLDEASRVAIVPSRPSTSNSRGPRLPPGSRQSPGSRPRSIRPVPSPAEPGFSVFTHANRPASRDYNDVDDKSRESRRKAPNMNSQPSTPPALASPRHTAPRQQRGVIECPPDPRYPNLILQPDSRGISQEQLATEVRSIYNGLASLEARCIKLDREQAIQSEKGPIPPNTWRALISIHRALLNDHHDFFLASQHPSAAPPLHRLAIKYNMPARMWKHGIHGFLELLRHQLPASLEFMISFIYLAYQMMSLLLETVPSFEDTWIECLGDLSRYRMAVEEEDPKDRETWSNVAKYWYTKAADRMPNTGRLYHHLAILARPNALQQAFLYSRSLTSAQPFLSARESVTTLFEPVIRDGATYMPEVDACFIKTLAFIFYRRFDSIDVPAKRFEELLDGQIGRITARWREFGLYIAGSTIGALFDFGNKNTFLRVFEVGNYLHKELNISKDSEVFSAIKSPFEYDAESTRSFKVASNLFFMVLRKVLGHSGDKNTYANVHVSTCFVLALVSFFRAPNTFPELQQHIQEFLVQVPWEEICNLLNMISASGDYDGRYETFDFLRPVRGDPGPLPEDYLLRGMMFTQTYYPKDWFDEVDVDEVRMIEHASTEKRREERLLWIGYKFAQYGCLLYDSSKKRWVVNTESVLVIQPNHVPISKDIHMDDAEQAAERDIKSADVDMTEAPPTPAINLLLPQSSAPAENSEFIQVKTFTTIVVDSNIIMKNVKVFDYLVSQKFTVAVSEIGWTRLNQLAKSSENHTNRAAANDAVEKIKDAVHKVPNEIRLLNREAEDVTTLLQNSAPSQVPENNKDEDDSNLVHLTRRASDLPSRARQHPPFDTKDGSGSKPKTAALLTDDNSVLSKAEDAGIYVLALEKIREWMSLPLRGRASSMGSATSNDVKPETVT